MTLPRPVAAAKGVDTPVTRGHRAKRGSGSTERSSICQRGASPGRRLRDSRATKGVAMSDVTILAPSPTLTVTVEDHPQGSEIHVHAGGQGVWQARMLRRLHASVTMCCVLTGEVGRTLHHLLEDERVTVHALHREGRGSAYVHDRRGGKRIVVDEEEGD